jgi:hypothetical protein
MKTKTTLTMMKLFSCAMLLVSCISFEDAKLDDKTSGPKTVSAPPKSSSSKAMDLNANYSCVKDWPYLSMSGTALQVGLNEAKGNCFGVYFDTKDVSKSPVIKVRAKFSPSSKVASVDILAGFTDDKGGKTYVPEKSKIVKSGADYTDYYFDYTNEMKTSESYVDPTKVKSILIFVNILGVDNLSGTLSVEEISLQAKM